MALTKFAVAGERDCMKRTMYVLALCIVVLAGCRAVEAPDPQLAASQEVGGEPAPTVTIESLDPSIPLGDSFPIVVNLENAPANQQVEFELVNGDIIPSTSQVVANTDASGRATIRLSGRSTKAEFNALYARAYLEDGSEIVGELYVNFEPPQTISSDMQATNLKAQAEDSIGEPVTYEEYAKTLPLATSLDDLESASESSTSGVRIEGVRFPEENGELGEPINAIEFSSGTQVGDTSVIPSGTCTLTSTHMYLKTLVSGQVSSFPAGTKVFISGSGTTPDKTTYTTADGRVSFQFGCASALYIRVQGLSNTGLQTVSGNDESGFPLTIWSKSVKAATSRSLTADGLEGDTVQLSTTAANSTSTTTQQVYTKVERARQWEISTHDFYTGKTFPISVVYPDGNRLIPRSRAHYARMFIKGGSSDYTLYHEFGHEVYYRRLLGADQYMYYYNRAIATNNTGFPICAGYLNGWTRWEHQENCEAMLEGFADWFERVYRSVAINQDYAYEYRGTKSDGSPADKGESVPGNVAAFLWDITDYLPSQYPVRDDDNDEVHVTGSVAERYARVAGFFHHHNTNENFGFVWRYRILAQRPESVIPDYCKVLKRNTINNSTVTMAGCTR